MKIYYESLSRGMEWLAKTQKLKHSTWNTITNYIMNFPKKNWNKKNVFEKGMLSYDFTSMEFI